VNRSDTLGRRSVRRWAFALITLALALVLCAGAAVAAETSRSAASKLGPVKISTFKGPWLKWNKTTCQFDRTNVHPKVYRPVLRKFPSPTTIGYTPETTVFPFDLLMNNSIERAARGTNIQLQTISNEFPSKTKPLQAADQMVQIKPRLIISGNIVSELYPAIQDKYFEACIPFINEFAMPIPKPVPMYQSSFRFDGNTMGTTIASFAKKRDWPLKDTWVIFCSDPTIATAKGSIADIGRFFMAAVKKALPQIPADHFAPFLSCPVDQGPLKPRVAVLNWLTAHPEAKYVLGGAWDDSPRGLGMVQALNQRRFGTRAAIVGRGGDLASIKLLAAKDPIFAADLDPGFSVWGPALLALTQDIVAGKPVPTLVAPPNLLITSANANAAIARLKKLGIK